MTTGPNFHSCTPAGTPNPQVFPTITWGLQGNLPAVAKPLQGDKSHRGIFTFVYLRTGLSHL